MKSVDRLKFTATGASSNTSASTITVVAAATGCRDLAQTLSDESTRTNGLIVGDTLPMTAVDTSNNWQTGIYQVTSSTLLTLQRVLSSSAGGTTPATFNGGALTAFHTPAGETYRHGLVDPDDVGYDIWLVIGQSNSAGRGTVDTYVDVTAPGRIFQYGSDSGNTNTLNKIVLASDPLSHVEGSAAGTGVGPGMPFAHAYAALTPAHRKILLVPYAQGSTGLTTSGAPWKANAGSNLLTQSVTKAQAALTAAQLIYPNSRIVGALWAQGEYDADNNVDAATYNAGLKALISYVRTTLSNPTMLFMIHGMNPDYVSSRANYQVIQQALSDVASQTDHCVFVAGPSGAAYDNGVHYTSAGYRILGAKSALLVPTARRYIAPPVVATALTISTSTTSGAVGSTATFNISTDHPLTGAQTVTATVATTGTLTGNGSLSATTVTLTPTTGTVAVTFTSSAAGIGNITATQSAGTPTVISASQAYTAANETLTVNTPATQTVGNSYSVTGTYAYGTPTALDYSIDSGTTWTAATSPTISGGNYSFSVTPTTSSASRTMMVRDHNNTSVTATSGTYVVNAAPAETITVNTPATQTAGTAFAVSGTYANGTPTALDWSVDNGTTWTAASSPTISGGTFSFSGVTVVSANASQTVKVRDHNATSVVGTSAAFVVSASSASPAQWSTTDKNAHINVTSSGGFTNNVASTSTGTASGWESIRTNISLSSGKAYVELTIANASSTMVGVGYASESTSDYIGHTTATPSGYGYYSSGSTFHNNGSATGWTGVAFTAGDIIGFEIDRDANTIEAFKGSTSIGKVTGVPAGSLYVMFAAQDGSPAPGVTLNAGQSNFARTPNAGFTNGFKG